MWKWEVVYEDIDTGERYLVSSGYLQDRVYATEYLQTWLCLNLPKMLTYRVISADVIYVSKKDINAENTIL